MFKYGWNLQGRQEIHEEGDAYGKAVNGNYVITTNVSHYVKLHFSRSLALPNLEQIRAIETEYNGLPFPSVQTPGCAILLLVLGVISLLPIGLLASLVLLGVITAAADGRDAAAIPAGVLGALVIVAPSLVIVVAAAFWIAQSKKKAQAAMQICEQSARRAGQLKAGLVAYI